MKQSAVTKERLLDAAEEIFAREGYRAASLRTITAAAAVNLAAVNYHYGSKRGLLEAIITRRLEAMNQARARGLTQVRAAARAAGRSPQARELLGAFIEATLGRARGGPGEQHFMALVVRSFSDTDHTVQRTFERFMKPTFETLYEAMAEALPELPAAELWWRLQFTIGAMVRVQHLTRGSSEILPRPDFALDPAGLAQELTSFIDSGMHAPPVAALARRKTPAIRSRS